MNNGRVALNAKKRGGVFWVMVVLVIKLKGEGNVLIDYYRRWGYTNYRTILLMCKTDILPPIKERRDHVNNICQTCLKRKMTRTIIPRQSDTETREPRELVLSNLCKPMKTRSIQGNTYMVTYLDDKTKWIHLGFLNKKS